MTASIDTSRPLAAGRAAHADSPLTNGVTTAAMHVVTSTEPPPSDAFGLSSLVGQVQRFAARGTQSMSALQSAVRASVAAARGEGALAQLSAIAALSLAALGFQAHAATPLPTTTVAGRAT